MKQMETRLTLGQVTQAARPASHGWGWRYDGARFWPPVFDGDLERLHLTLEEFEATCIAGQAPLRPPQGGWRHYPDCDCALCRSL